MAIALIQAWLRAAHKNYTQGVALYNQHGDDELLKILFNNGSSNYHLIRLQEALTELADKTPFAVPVKTFAPVNTLAIPALESIPVPATTYSLTDSEWQKAPDAIKDLFTQNQRLKSRADLLFLQARSAPTAGQRLQLALAQLDDREQINKNWKIIKEYQATGVLQEQITAEQEKPINELSISELLKLSKNLPPNISKDTAKLKDLKPNTTRYDKTARRLQENKIKLKLVKERLANELV